MNHQHQVITAHNFSAAFEQMCSMVAIGNTKGADETVMELVLHCLFFLPDEEFVTLTDFSKAADGLFGLKIPEHEVEFSLEQLIAVDHIRKSANDQFILPETTKRKIQQSVDSAYALETKVRDAWQGELESNYPYLDTGCAWHALRNYLARAFQRHGIQAAALLDPAIENDSEHSESLNIILDEVVKGEFQTDQHQVAKAAISDFMATTGNYADRATYISQLADGAFTYFSLTISPDIARKFTENLNSLVLFFDTNFLFGILDLTVNPQVAVSNELINAIKKYNLPFEFRMHPATSKELQTSIDNYAAELNSRQWSPQISRAAAKSLNLSGVELRYHQRFAETGITVEAFFRPFHHADVLLAEKRIDTISPENNRTEERAKLISEYKEFLESRKKDKSYKLIDHDMTVLDIVRQLRSESASTLEAGALLVTCDYSLYRFDWETSRKMGEQACTVLPNIFWQILRPFIPRDINFDRSFAETFAIPEFRIMGSRASEATSKMLNIMAGYKGLSEETAIRMLSNDILIERLRTVENSDAFQQYVESAIADENILLAEEKAFVEKQLEKEKEKSSQTEKHLQEEKKKIDTLETNLSKQATELEREKTARIRAEKKASEAEKEKEEIILTAQREKERIKFYLGIGKSIALGTILIVVFEFAIFRIPWNWILTHANSLGLQASLDLLLIMLSFSVFIPKWRKNLIVGGLFPIILIVIQLLGGITNK